MNISTKEEFDAFLKSPRKYLRYKELEISYPYPEEYKALVQAIKIRKRKERIAYIYDNACDRIDAYNEENKLICQFCDGRCREASKGGRINGCCYRCRFQSSTGCPSRNLTCKLYFCDEMLAQGPLRFENFPEFQLLTRLQKNIVKTNAYCTRETSLRLMYINSYLVFYLYSIRNVFDMEFAEQKNKKLDKMR